MKRLIFILFGLWIMAFGLWGQETIVVGEVYDANTGEPLPNVNIYLQGTQVGTSTNAEGLFLLREDLDRSRTMVVSAVGYHTERFKIEPHTQSGIDVALREKVGNLAEVFVVPQDNPALPLMEKVRARRGQNRRVVLSEELEGTTALYVSDIQSKNLKRAIWRSLQSGMIQQEDSSYLIPLYWREQHADTVREEATLLTVTDYQMLLGQVPTTFDFYDNTLPFLSTSMLSPLAASGNAYYQYYLVDSVLVGDEKHYILHFKTKNPFYATFNGEMTIDSASCALRSINVSVPTQNSVNYLKEFTIRQTYAQNNQLQSEQVNMLLDFAIKAPSDNDTTHIFPTLLLTRSTERLLDIAVGTDIELPIVTDEMILPALDSLNNTPLFKTAKFVAYLLQTGCVPTDKYVEVGKIYHTIKFNPQEGLRLGVPLRTTENLWKNVCLEGMLAYGVGDRAFKGFGQVSVVLPSQRRHIVRLKYSDNYMYSEVDDFHEYIRENKVFNPQVHLITDIFRGAKFNAKCFYNTMTRRQEGRVHFYDDWNKYLETQAYVKVGKTGYGEATNNYQSQAMMSYSTVGLSARLSFNERKVDTYFRRRHIYNHLPVLYLGAELGSYRLDNMQSYRMYGNLQLMLRHHVDLGMGGELNYLLQAGLVFGKVPYPLLYHFAGNQTYVFDIHRFSLMNNYQYAADKYISLQAHWNGKGVLFNLIPGVRYARLRELLELKVAYGGLRKDHQEVLPFPTTKSGYNTLAALRIPYVEVGVGIGNILRIGEVYGVFRLTQSTNQITPLYAIRFRLYLGV